MKYDKKAHEILCPALAFCGYFLYNKFTFYKGGYWRVGELIAVLSGKGGTGKTSVCAGIATALALQGERVLCIDCDVGLRNLDIALGISELGTLSFLEVCRGDQPVEMALRHPVYPELSFLTAPVNCLAEDIDKIAFAKMLTEARQKFSYVFLDAPAGLDAGFSLAAAYADRVLLVTGPDPASIRDAGQTADVLEKMGKTNVRLIVNRISEKMAKAMALTVDDVMDRAGLPLQGVVPEDPNVTLAAAFRQPLLGYSRKGAAAKACVHIAQRIRGMRVRIPL